ncbi:hypothetical protein CFOL_v3_12508, partial [Cephalotus follicularis]
WKRTTIFHTFIQCGERSCKFVIDNGSCINVVSKTAIGRLNVKVEPHRKPFRVFSVNKTFLPISERCLVPIEIGDYENMVYYDVFPMDVAHVLLGCPWFYDLDVINHGRKKFFAFTYKGNKIIRNPTNSCPKDHGSQSKVTPLVSIKKSLHILDQRAFEKESQETRCELAIVTRESPLEISTRIADLAPKIDSLLGDYSDVIHDELPCELPPMRDIQHAINLVSGSRLPNLP